MKERVDFSFENNPRWLDLLAIILLFLMLQTAASQLIATGWVDDLQITWFIVFLGIVLGTALGYSRFSSLGAFFLAFLYGVLIVPWQLGLTLSFEISWRMRLLFMFDAFNLTFNQIENSENVSSPLLFLTVVAIVTFGLSVFAAYMLVRRGEAWKAVIPTGLLMIVVSTYGVKDGTNLFLFGLFVFISLLLIARLSYLHRHVSWNKERTILPADLGYQTTKVIIISVTLLIVFAWSVPALGAGLPSIEDTWRQITDPLDDVRDEVGRIFAPIDTSIGLVGQDIVRDYYGESLPLGRGNLLTDELVLIVEAPKLSPDVPRYYWRARFYDYYQDGRWRTQSGDVKLLTPEEFDLKFEEYKKRWQPNVTINPQRRLATLYTPTDPQWVSRPVEAQLATYLDSAVDVIALHPSPFLNVGDVYFVRASLSQASIAELQSAGVDYADWVKERYLQLPDDITGRTRELARDITAGLQNPYDKAAAITEYLRTNIRYNEVLADVPSDQEKIDWLLFDGREGFCNYYASAEVIMLRSLGIPARLVVGYSQGEISNKPLIGKGLKDEIVSSLGGDLENTGFYTTYIVRQKYAHAWPEVYFPGYGWVEFEPTSAQQLLIRPLGIQVQEANGIINSSGRDVLSQNGLERDHPIMDEEVDQFQDNVTPESNLLYKSYFLPDNFYQILKMVSVLALFWWLISFTCIYKLETVHWSLHLVRFLHRVGINPPGFLERYAILASISPIKRAYYELDRSLHRLGFRSFSTFTPSERGTILLNLLPQARKPIEEVVTAYNILAYSPHGVEHSRSLLQAAWTLRILSYKTLLYHFLRRIRKDFL
jgi:transglutaminase-like putative cysteine protease